MEKQGPSEGSTGSHHGWKELCLPAYRQANKAESSLQKPLVPEAESNITPLVPGPKVRENSNGTKAHLFLLFSQAVPHGGHNFGNIPKGGTGVLPLDGSLSVSEEESVGRHWLLWLIGILLLLLLWILGLFAWVC